MKKVLILSLVILILLVTGTVIGNVARNSSAVTAPTDASGNIIPTQPDGTPATEAPTDSEVREPVDAHWFDDAVFVGDSITLKLSYYCDSHPEAMGGVQFFCAGSLGYGSSLWDIDDPQAVHPYYKGEIHLAEECAEVTGAKKVFIMLGMNDIAVYGIEGTIEKADELYNNILTRSPDATLYIQSVTPILYGHEVGDLNNQTILEFNAALSEYCSEHGYKYFDINSIMADETGYLREEYCGDPGAMGIHFTDEACQKWIEKLIDDLNA